MREVVLQFVDAERTRRASLSKHRGGALAVSVCSAGVSRRQTTRQQRRLLLPRGSRGRRERGPATEARFVEIVTWLQTPLLPPPLPS